MTGGKKAVFLDRDGVLNRAAVREGRPYPPANLAEMELLPGVKQACDQLCAAGFLLIVVTNQPDIGRGAQTRECVDEMNCWLQTELRLDDVRMCPHDDAAACGCRKPAPGMLLEAAAEWEIDLAQSFLVGDRWRDIAAGQAAGCRAIFIDCGYSEKRPAAPFFGAADLSEAAEWIFAQPGRDNEILNNDNSINDNSNNDRFKNDRFKNDRSTAHEYAGPFKR